MSAKVAYRFTELDSTNAEALRLLKGPSLPAPYASVRAHFQTAGRGQAGNGWFSSPHKNLLCSVIVYPERWLIADLFRLTQVLSLSSAAIISELTGLRVRIKWPNDLYLGDKKVAGLLIQNSLQGRYIQWSVLGLGLNIEETDFPAELRDKAVSLRQSVSPQLALPDPDGWLDLLIATLKSEFKQLQSPVDFVRLDERYHDLLYRRGETHRFQRTDTKEIFVATLLGVVPDGRLRLRKTDGREELFTLKSIAFL